MKKTKSLSYRDHAGLRMEQGNTMSALKNYVFAFGSGLAELVSGKEYGEIYKGEF